jgi:trans-aconitate methyltransferase
MEISDVTKAWDRVAGTAGAQEAIHPLGGVGSEEYEASGRSQARQVSELIWTYVIPHVDGEPRVADFGCGDGRVLRYVAEEFPDSWGLDASPIMLAKLVERVPGVATMESDGTGVSLDELGADFIYSLAVFIHHDHNGGVAMMEGLARGINPGGFLALQIPCYGVARERNSWTDVTVWTKDQIESAARTADLSVVELWENSGEFSFSAIGPNHHRMQVFRKD